jgi:hypothetical protein
LQCWGSSPEPWAFCMCFELYPFATELYSFHNPFTTI